MILVIRVKINGKHFRSKISASGQIKMVHSYERGGDKMNKKPAAVGSMSEEKESMKRKKREQKAMTITQSSVELRW